MSIHVACGSWVAVDPPSTPNTGLPIKDSELVKAQSFLESTSCRNTGLPCTNYENRVVGVSIFAVCMAFVNPCHRRRHLV
jgi:hypothetical protein